jgi:hypothetical protein
MMINNQLNYSHGLAQSKQQIGYCIAETLLVHGQTHIQKTHHSPNLGETITFPIIVYYVFGHEANTQMSCCPGTPISKIPKIETPATLEAHNFMCKPMIEMTSQAKL